MDIVEEDIDLTTLERYVPPPPRRRHRSGSLYRRGSDGLWCGKIEIPTPVGAPRKNRVVTGKTFCGMLKKFSELEKPPMFAAALTMPRRYWYYTDRQDDLARGGLIATHTEDEWQEQCRSQGGRCFYCGKSCFLDKEHQTPLSRGGSDGIDNIVGACPSCNSRKGAMTAEEYIAYLACQE